MKKALALLLVILMMASLVGCGKKANAETTPREPTGSETTDVVTELPAEDETSEAEAAEAEVAEEDIVYEGDASSYYIDEVYAEQIARYYMPLCEKWNEEQYLDNGMSEVLAAYYEGNPLENVGFGFVDMDNDGNWELVIGAIQDAAEYPAVFEIWTLVDDKPVMLAQAHARNQYTLQYVAEDEMWYVVNEGSGSAFCHATYYLMLSGGQFEVVQGIVYDASADEQNPWFMTYDMDWDTSNDEHIDEETANAIIEANRAHYTALEYFPYIYFSAP